MKACITNNFPQIAMIASFVNQMNECVKKKSPIAFNNFTANDIHFFNQTFNIFK